MSRRTAAEVAKWYRWYAAEHFHEYEPLYERLARAVADDERVCELVARHPDRAQQPNLLFAAVRWLLSTGLDPALATLYASGGPELDARFCEFVLARRDQVDELLKTRATQTNEVGRTAVLRLALNHVQRQTRLPLAWIDLGTSAGLNLLLEHYGVDYELGKRTLAVGPADATVRIASHVLNADALLDPEPLDIAWRLGIDQAPLDASDEADRQWLKACIFPSLEMRADRLQAALHVAAGAPPSVRKLDAADLGDAIAEAPPDTHLVVTTTYVWYYLPLDVRAAALDAMRTCGRPVSWVSLEANGVVEGLNAGQPPPGVNPGDGCPIGLLAVGGSGEQHRVLGWSHPHGAWIRWDVR